GTFVNNCSGIVSTLKPFEVIAYDRTVHGSRCHTVRTCRVAVRKRCKTHGRYYRHDLHVFYCNRDRLSNAACVRIVDCNHSVLTSRQTEDFLGRLSHGREVCRSLHIAANEPVVCVVVRTWRCHRSEYRSVVNNTVRQRSGRCCDCDRTNLDRNYIRFSSRTSVVKVDYFNREGSFRLTCRYRKSCEGSVVVRCVTQRSCGTFTIIPVVAIVGTVTRCVHVQFTQDVGRLQTAGRSDEVDKRYTHCTCDLVFDYKFHQCGGTVISRIAGFNVVRSWLDTCDGIGRTTDRVHV